MAVLGKTIAVASLLAITIATAQASGSITGRLKVCAPASYDFAKQGNLVIPPGGQFMAVWDNTGPAAFSGIRHPQKLKPTTKMIPQIEGGPMIETPKRIVLTANHPCQNALARTQIGHLTGSNVKIVLPGWHVLFQYTGTTPTSRQELEYYEAAQKGKEIKDTSPLGRYISWNGHKPLTSTINAQAITVINDPYAPYVPIFSHKALGTVAIYQTDMKPLIATASLAGGAQACGIRGKNWGSAIMLYLTFPATQIAARLWPDRNNYTNASAYSTNLEEAFHKMDEAEHIAQKTYTASDCSAIESKADIMNQLDKLAKDGGYSG